MNWKVEFYSKKVKDNILHWPIHLNAKILRIVELVKKMGPYEIGMPHVKALKNGLWEIRIKSDEGIARAPFCTINYKIVIILSEFIKKTQKMHARELDIATRRIQEVKRHEKENKF